MTIHGAAEGRTVCGLSVERRWWVPSKPYTKTTQLGWKEVDQRPEITCKACKNVLRINP